MKSDVKLMILKAKNKSSYVLLWILTVFCGIMLIGAFGALFTDGGPSMIIPILIFGGLGAFCVIKMKKNRKTAATLNKFTEYVARLSNDDTRSIVKLAQGMREDMNVTIASLEQMIKLSLFCNAYIDYQNNTLVIPKKDIFGPADKLRVIKCGCCGALTKVVEGTVSTCEFCGAYLQG